LVDDKRRARRVIEIEAIARDRCGDAPRKSNRNRRSASISSVKGDTGPQLHRPAGLVLLSL
jgi:hypothetical protein